MCFLRWNVLNQRDVFDSRGNRAILESLDDNQASLRLEDGHLISLPRTALVVQDDSSYRVAFDLTHFQEAGAIVIPVTQEEVNIDKREVEHVIRISKTVRSEDVVVDQPLNREDIEVERVPINRYVDEPLAVRH